MDWFKTIMLILGITTTVAFSVSFARAIRRREGGHIYGGLVTAASMVVIYTDIFWPNAIHAAVPLVRWLAVTVMILVFANMFGFGQWLFRRKAEHGTEEP